MTCKACGLDHPSGMPCGRARRIAEYETSLVANNQIDHVIVVANSIELVANISKHGKYANKDKRRIYMRDYMKKRRTQTT